ncbi:aromatic amino acid ammonia-lyase [Agreia sp. VKM Ac-1783]|uniref:aromatic amino acid ammonia-lyase n=1 Tax=Agreia sp. VKM Ac-1783 TaxID=1938889 RepID=UPI000A2AA527|nr:aromatic amino acid ammonia-lyase [Agreia sp. VKM Ac-1783]SMQ68520.1 histidine ammonia-lyase [Agreia sp. VKM Ac-1783]
MGVLRLEGQSITIDDVVAVADGASIELAPGVVGTIARARCVVESVQASGSAVYGLNTHLGAGRDTRVAADEVAAFQNQIIDNHRGSIGDPLAEREVRALIFARVVGFSLGGSGVRPELADAYGRLLDGGPLPEVYATGSVGASDLALLAEVAAHVRQSLPFAAGEALAAISANSYSIGVGPLAVAELRALVAEADAVAALSLEALGAMGGGGSLSPFDDRVHRHRRSPGQQQTARAIRARVAGGFLDAPEREGSVQDPLSFRTVPQVHGAVRDATALAASAIEDELNTAGDNPLVVLGGDDVMLSNGNFEPLTLVLSFESLRVALAHLAGISERRIAVLSGLATPLRRSGSNAVPGLSWYAAAASLAEVRHLANPVSTSGTTLSQVEDQASFAPLAVRLLQQQIGLCRQIFAVEALHAAQLVRSIDSPPRLGRGTRQLATELVERIGRLDTARDLVIDAVKAVALAGRRDTIDQ